MPVSPRPLDPTKQQPQYSQHRRPSRTFLTSAGVLIERVAERLLTFCYHESFQRNTIEPLTRIIAAADHDARSHLLREWADLKAEESKYIQIAGGFLFTTVATCLTWPATVQAHWTAPALFYLSTVFALVAIVSSSQQLWILPRLDLAHALLTGDVREKNRRIADLSAFLDRVQRARDGKLKAKYLFALQAPIMLLTLSVLTFLAGLCSTIFSPLAVKLMWDDDAKISVMFGVGSAAALFIFASTSTFIYALFRSTDVGGP